MVLLQLVYAQTVLSTTGTIPTPQNPQSSDFGYYLQKHSAAPPPSHKNQFLLATSKDMLLVIVSSCSAVTLNSLYPSQINNFCLGYRVAAQQALQQQR
jgi:hypothetical protein